MNLKGVKVLVTGGTGFIGGRLVERLVTQYGAHVRVLVRNFTRTPRISRFHIEMFPGDITDPVAVERAIEGCDILFHCVYGSTGTPIQRRKVTVQGTENVLKAASKHKVQRMVHVSTISVYGKTEDGDLDETAPRKYSKDVYADAKLEAEKLVFNYFKKHGLPVSIVQPTIVYGPFSMPWTIGPLNQLKKGRIIMVEEGSGLCNAVYVDDVVQALLLAATSDEAIGEAFLISGEAPVTWRDFYSAYENMLCVESTVSMSLDEIRRYRRHYQKEHSTIGQLKIATRQHPEVLNGILKLPAIAKAYYLVKILSPESWRNRLKSALIGKGNAQHNQLSTAEKPMIPLTAAQTQFFRARTHVRIDKARRLLGYKPGFNLEQGMKLTEEWVRWFGLLK